MGFSSRKFFFFFLFLLFFVFLFPPHAWAATYYVATNGDDANPGTIDQPWRRIQHGADQLQPGDTLLVRGGFYDDCRVEPKNHGQEGAWITIKNYPGEQPVLDKLKSYCQDDDQGKGMFGFFLGVEGVPDEPVDTGSYVEISGFKIRNFWFDGIACWNTHHVKITNNIIEYGGSDGIGTLRHGCDHLTIENNIIRYTGRSVEGVPGRGWGSGISLNFQSGPFEYKHDGQFHNFIRHNIIYGSYDPGEYDEHSEGSGIITDLGGDIPPTLIEGNLIFNNGRTCVNVYQNDNVWVIGNTCYQNCEDEYYSCNESWQSELTIEGHQADGVTVLGNIVHAGRAAALYASESIIADYNLYFGGEVNGKTGPNDIIGQDPQLASINIDCSPETYANPQGICASDNPDDFRAYFGLRPGSPAIDKIPESAATYQGPGQTEHIIKTDLASIFRPQGAGYELGAYEFVEVEAPTPTPTVGPATPTPSPITPFPCPLNGDYDQNGVVNEKDFESWKTDFLTGTSNLSCFEYWRRAYFKTSPLTPIPTPISTPALTPTPPATGNIYYVAINGDDNNPGTLEKPWRTIQKAADSVQAGDTIYVRAGTYKGEINWTKSGRSDAPITLTNFPGESFTIFAEGQAYGISLGRWSFQERKIEYVQFIGDPPGSFKIRDWGHRGSGEGEAGINILSHIGINHITIKGIELTGSRTGWAIVMESRGGYMDYNVIEDSIIHDLGTEGWGSRTYQGYGIVFWGDDGRNRHTIIRRNKIYRTARLAISIGPDTAYLSEVPNEDIEIYDNEIYDTGDNDYEGGIQIMNSKNIKIHHNKMNNIGRAIAISNSEFYIYNNLIVNSRQNGIQIYSWSEDKSNLFGNIYHNTVYNSQEYNIWVGTPANYHSEVKNNIFYAGEMGSLENFEASNNLTDQDPLFVNAQGGDFHLQANSPAIDAGTDVGIDTDFDGTPRPQGAGFDIGAFECKIPRCQ